MDIEVNSIVVVIGIGARKHCELQNIVDGFRE